MVETCDNPHSVYYTEYIAQFSVSGGGVSQVILHAKSQTHNKVVPSQTQSLLMILPTGHVAHTHGGPEVLSEEMQALKAGIIETLHNAEYNHSFPSAEKDGERYQLMFPGHPAAEKYSYSSTKSAYLLRYGISKVLKAEQIQDIKDVPYTFKFDEITISQVLKQYGGYLCYWSPMYDEVVNTYAGSLFMGHCSAVDLVKHFYEIGEPLDLKGVYLLHLGMDGPRVNKKCERELQASLHEKEDTSIMILGTCSLHPVHTAFKNGIIEVNFPFETFFNDLSFFFKFQPHGERITLELLLS